MWRNCSTGGALSFMPMGTTPGAYSSGPKRVPSSAATWNTEPAVFGLGFIATFGTFNVGFFVH
jgi:hypothetical protein